MPAQTKNLWVPIVTPVSGDEWINWSAVSTTRRGSKRLYLYGSSVDMHKQMLERVRFAKVTITEQKSASHLSFQGGAS